MAFSLEIYRRPTEKEQEVILKLMEKHCEYMVEDLTRQMKILLPLGIALVSMPLFGLHIFSTTLAVAGVVTLFSFEETVSTRKIVRNKVDNHFMNGDYYVTEGIITEITPTKQLGLVSAVVENREGEYLGTFTITDDSSVDFYAPVMVVDLGKMESGGDSWAFTKLEMGWEDQE